MTALPNDPTRAGAPVPEGGGAARASLPEIEALCAKAARGAGLSWGLAEEAGVAARWLAAHGLPGPELMARHLEAFDGRRWREVAPMIDGRTWRTRAGGRLCPLAAGSALSDHAGLAGGPGPRPLVLEDVASPAIILPFVGLAAERLGAPLRVEWSGFSAVVVRRGISISAGREGIATPSAARVSVIAQRAQCSPSEPADGRVIALSVWHRLDRLALRTTVPPCERSRRDAGAGATDND